MTRLFAICALLALLVPRQVDARPLEQGQPIPAAELEAFVDGTIRQAMETDHVAGAAVTIVQGDQVRLLKGYGLAALNPTRPVDPERTRFRIGSVSKLFTWLMLLQLADEGQLDLQAPINRHLPPELRIAPGGFSRPIRVVDLMAHAPGFDDPSFGFLLVRDPDLLPRRNAGLAAHQPRRVREPGQFGTYSNHGTVLGGVIVEEVSGRSFEAMSEAALFGPMGMGSTSFREPYAPRAGLPEPLPASTLPNFAQGLAWASGTYRSKPFEYFSHRAPSGSASTTAADMARFLRAQLRDGMLDDRRIWGPATARAIRTPILKANEGSNGWAHGFMELDMPGGVKGYAHGGATQDQTSYMMVIPSHDLGIFVATNSAAGFAIAERLPRLLLQRFYAAPVAPRPASPALDQQAELYAGTYVSTRRPYFGLEKFLMLPLVKADVTVSGGYLRTIAGSQARAYVPEGGPGRFRDAHGDEVLQFNLGPDGRALSFDTRQGTSRMERQPWWAGETGFRLLAAATTMMVIWMLFTCTRRLLRTADAPRSARRIDLLAVLTALVTLLALLLFTSFGLMLDPDSLLVMFPPPLLLASSVLALGAVGASIPLAASLPLVWRDKTSWSRRDAALLTISVALLLLLALGLWQRGFLSPWA